MCLFLIFFASVNEILHFLTENSYKSEKICAIMVLSGKAIFENAGEMEKI